MGIRVHKMIGYGVKDLKTAPERPDYEHSIHYPDDPRWDFKKYQEWWDSDQDDATRLLAWLEEPANAEKVIELARYEGWALGRERARNLTESTEVYLMKAGIKDLLEKNKGRSIYPSQAVTWDGEFGDAKVALFRPMEYSVEWSRYDDPIDYVEENGEVRATFLTRSLGIFPYNGFLKRFRRPSPEVIEKLNDEEIAAKVRVLAPKPQRKLPIEEIESFDGGGYNMLVGGWSKDVPALIKDEDVLRHLREDWRPRVPTGILAVMAYLDCFPNPTDPDSMLNSLRPMVYVYWA